MKSIVARTVQICLFLLVFTGPKPGLAQEDNTGTNPVNFTYDARFITEIAEFEGGGGSLLTNTFEFRWPLGRNVANLRGKENRTAHELPKTWRMGEPATDLSVHLEPNADDPVQGAEDILARQ